MTPNEPPFPPVGCTGPASGTPSQRGSQADPVDPRPVQGMEAAKTSPRINRQCTQTEWDDPEPFQKGKTHQRPTERRQWPNGYSEINHDPDYPHLLCSQDSGMVADRYPPAFESLRCDKMTKPPAGTVDAGNSVSFHCGVKLPPPSRYFQGGGVHAGIGRPLIG